MTAAPELVQFLPEPAPKKRGRPPVEGRSATLSEIRRPETPAPTEGLVKGAFGRWVQPRMTDHVVNEPPAVWRVTEADLPELMVWAAPLLVEKFPRVEEASIQAILRAMTLDRTIYLMRTKGGLGLAQATSSPWEPQQVVREVFTVAKTIDDRVALVRTMAAWAKDIGALTFVFDGGIELGEVQGTRAVML